jgi:predicted O-linked N-acetylglucosamine transferase (SPINDLY family)
MRAHVCESTRRAQQAWLHGQQQGRKGRWDEAAQRFEQAWRLQPSDALYGLTWADALIKGGRPDDALEVVARVVRMEPANPIARALQAQLLLLANRHDEVVALLAAVPDPQLDHELLRIRGVAQLFVGQADAAVGSLLRALALDPRDAPTHMLLGLAFNALKLKSEAAECFRTALLLGLGDLEVGVRDLLAFYEREVCAWQGGHSAVQALRDSIDRLPDDAAVETNPFAHVTLIDDPVRLLKAAAACARHFERRAVPLPPRRPLPRERLRVGYVSCDFHAHATAFLMAELVERHDRRRVEVFLYSFGRDDGSAVRQRLVDGADHFADLRSLGVRAMAERIRADGIDILVDLKGYTQDARPALLAHRAAPLQVAYLGFPGTTGSPSIDYLIGDPYVTPLEHAPHYSEKLAQLPGCYQCNDGRRPLPVAPSRAGQGLPEDAVVLCAFNQLYKISPDVFDVWCRLLQRLPHAVLWLVEWNPQAVVALRHEARARGVDPARLVFARPLPQAAHLDRVACADLFLDTWPCNAHTTASDMLWAGVPVVTCSGRTFASRVAGSLLHAVGVPELVCASVEAYEALVLELAQDAPRRLALRRRIEAARQTSSLFDGADIARRLERLYERMWERALAGQPPAALPAQG